VSKFKISHLGQYLLILALLGPVCIGTAIFLRESRFDSAKLAGPVAGNIEGGNQEEKGDILLFFQPVSFDPVRRKAKFNVFPWTYDQEQTFSSSMIAQKDFRLFIDELYGDGNYQIRRGESVGAFEFETDVLSIPRRGSLPSEFAYPFDSYVLDAYVGVFGDEMSESGIAAFDYFYDSALSNFSLTYTRIAGWNYYDMPGELNPEKIRSERSTGKISFLVGFTRPFGDRSTVFLICAVLLINTISLIWIMRKVLSRNRPPSLQVLVWAAASVLGYVQLRESFPGDPRLGIAIDYLFYFPALLTSAVVALLTTHIWSNRNDFE